MEPRCHLRGQVPDTPLLKHIIPNCDSEDNTAYLYEESKGSYSSQPYDYNEFSGICP